MADELKPPRKVRFTVLEMGSPLNPSPEELAARVVGLAPDKMRLTVLEMGSPLNPSPEELATRIVEPLINVGPLTPLKTEEVPPTVDLIITQLADAIGALTPAARAVAVSRAVTALNRKLAG